MLESKRVADLCRVHFLSSKRFKDVSMMFQWILCQFGSSARKRLGRQFENLSSWNPSWNPSSQVDLEASPGKARLKWSSNVVRCQLKSTDRASRKIQSFGSETGLAKTGSWRGPCAKHQIRAANIQNLDSLENINRESFWFGLPRCYLMLFDAIWCCLMLLDLRIDLVRPSRAQDSNFCKTLP